MMYQKYSDDLLICELTESDCNTLQIRDINESNLDKLSQSFVAFVRKLVNDAEFSNEFVIEFNEPLLPGFFMSLFIWSRDFFESPEFEELQRIEQEFEDEEISEEDFNKLISSVMQHHVGPANMSLGNNEAFVNDVKNKYLLVSFENVIEGTQTLLDISSGKWGRGFDVSVVTWDGYYYILLSPPDETVFATLILTAGEKNVYNEVINKNTAVLLAEHGNVIFQGAVL